MQPHYGLGVNSASNRKEHQGYLLEGGGGEGVWLEVKVPCV